MKKITITALLLCFFFMLPLAAEEKTLPPAGTDKITEAETPREPALTFRGLLRNDAVLSTQGNEAHFSDVLEGRLILDYRARLWRLYADGRLYAFFGEEGENEGRYRARLMRAFIRYFSPAGDFTAGKTCINFGTPGLFNPFESDKQVILTDLSYDREGILALEYRHDRGEKSGVKLYGGSDLEENDTGSLKSTWRGGGSLWTNLLRFDTGLVANHLDSDRNLAGLYLKGDIMVGLQSAWALHFSDDFTSRHHEAMAGADYSFFSGKIIVCALFYYNGTGMGSAGTWTYRPDGYFAARYYTYGEIKYLHDEFFSAGVYGLTNCIDGSTLIVPSFSVVAANGLTVTLLFSTVTGKGNNEFSGDTAGWFSTVLRIEGKF